MNKPKTSDEWTRDDKFDDPGGYADLRVAESLAANNAFLEQRYKTDKFWGVFHSIYGDLKSEQTLCTDIINANLDALKGLPIEEAMDRIAEQARSHKDAQVRYWEATKDHRHISGGPGFTGTRVPSPQELGISISNTITRRKAERRSAPERIRGE